MMVLNHDSDDEFLESVAFFATGLPTYYSISIYDTFSGGALSNLLVGSMVDTVDNPGYYEVDLPSPLPLVSGDPVYIAIEFTTPSYGYPIPYDNSGPMATNKTYVSNDGSSFAALDNGGYAFGDVSIRGIIVSDTSSSNCSTEGIPEIQTGFPSGQQTAVKGENWCHTITPRNSGAGTDTFCVEVFDTKGWSITAVPHLSTCTELLPGENWLQEICVMPPCAAASGELDTVYAVMAYCDFNGTCSPECGNNDTTMVVLSAADPGYGIAINNNARFYIEAGDPSASVPFEICNPNPCAPAASYNYQILSAGYSSGGCTILPVDQSGATGSVNGGDCEIVYATIDASAACAGDTASLQIISWTGSTADTSVQVVEITEQALPIPALSSGAVIIMILGMILLAVILIKKRKGYA
jgi:hypothetical protein